MKNKQFLLSYNRKNIINTKEFECFSYIFNNLIINDFAIIGKENYLNKDYEDYVYIDLDYRIIFDILNDDIIKCLSNVNFINLASASGKFIFISSFLYSFNEYVGIENIRELYELSKLLLNKLQTSDYNFFVENKKINFINDSLLSADLNNKNLIILDYNNSNKFFQNMLENKIINEAENNSIIIKIFTPFKKNIKMKLLKIKVLKTTNNKPIMVYYYSKEK